jgi:hypothetical protein
MLVDELCSEFATDTPGKTALAGTALGQYDGEIGGDIDVFGDHLHATVGNIRDRTVAWQGAGPELDLGETPAESTFACTTVG